jgi:hypothetical protein
MAIGTLKPSATSSMERLSARGKNDAGRCRSAIEVIDITGMRQGAFDTAVAHASHGSRIVYHLGEFCAGPHRRDARAAYEDGRVLLTTRKRSHLQFEYLAIPVSPKR